MDRRIVALGPRFIQERIMMRILAAKYEEEQFSAFVSLIQQSRHDLYQATYQNLQGYFWRNFSKYVVYFHSRQKNQDLLELT